MAYMITAHNGLLSENNIGIHLQALSSHFNTIINHRNPITNPKMPTKRLICFALFVRIGPVFGPYRAYRARLWAYRYEYYCQSFSERPQANTWMIEAAPDRTSTPHASRLGLVGASYTVWPKKEHYRPYAGPKTGSLRENCGKQNKGLLFSIFWAMCYGKYY